MKELAKRMATYSPSAAKKHADRRQVHLQGQPADRPEGRSGQARHPRHLGLVGLGRVEPDHHQEPPRHRDRLQRRRSSPTGAPGGRTRTRRRSRRCCGRAGRRARRTGTSTRTSPGTRTSRRVQERRATGNWEHFADAKATSAARPVEGARSTRRSSSRSRRSCEKIWLEQLPIVPLFIGPRWSTYSTKYFHCFCNAEELLRRPDLHDLPRQHPLLHPDLPGRQDRRVSVS